MNTLRNLLFGLLLAYGGFMSGYFFAHPEPVKEVAKEEKPPTNIDWEKFYSRLFMGGDWEVAATIGLTTDNHNLCNYTLFLVDGDRWIRLKSHTDHGVRGCGRPLTMYRFFVTFDDDFTNKLTRPPGKNARFVAVGLGNPIVVEQSMRYFNKKTGKEFEDNDKNDKDDN